MNKKGNIAIAWLKHDYVHLQVDPIPYVLAEPVLINLLEWHYVIMGPKNILYKGGYYHGKIIFPDEFPPSIYMLTPNG